MQITTATGNELAVSSYLGQNYANSEQAWLKLFDQNTLYQN